MKLVTFEPPGAADAALGEEPPLPGSCGRLGVLSPDTSLVVDLRAAQVTLAGQAEPAFADMLALLDADTAGLDRAAATLEAALAQQPPGVIYPVGEVRLLSPVPRPRSIRDCLTFERHLLGATATMVRWRSPLAGLIDRGMRRLFKRPLVGIPKVWYERPIYYKSNPHSVVGPDAEVHWPRYTERLDYELEFGIYIGRRGKDIPADRAAQHIAGYCIFNDFSARDIQAREMQGRLGPAKGKDFDTGNVIGPWLVTRDEVPDPYALEMSASVNGERWSHGNSGEMQFSFEEIIAYISQDETLYPGEFIGSGTVGSGCGLELDRWLQPGDTVELEVSGLGRLRNRVVRG